jgi:cleavage and polyadenylation specificity factor subunit 3
MAAAVDDEPVDPSDEVAFHCLGGGNEVGRSCHIIQYKGKTVMVCNAIKGCTRIFSLTHR